MNSSSWAIEHISKTLPNEIWESLLDNRFLAIYVLAETLAIAIIYSVINRVLFKFCAPFRVLRADAQLVVTHHAIEALVLSLFFIPATYLTMSVLFEDQDLVQLDSKVLPLFVYLTTVVVMYAFEMATRYRKLRPVLILHHLVASLDGLFILCFPSTATVKTAAILVYFITYESVTFFGLLLYRLYPYSKATPKVIFTGIIVMGVSRPFQLLLVLGSLFASWNEIVIWHAVVQILVTMIVTSVQIYSLNIHYGLYKRCLRKQREGNKDMCNDDGAYCDLEHNYDAGASKESGEQRTIVSPSESSS